MRDDIQLRDYLQVIFRYRWRILQWILGVFALVMIGSFVLPPVYETQTLVFVREPSFEVNFDERFIPSGNTRNEIEFARTVYQSLPPLAISDDVLTQMLNQLDPPLPPAKAELLELRESLDARLVEGTNAVQLTVEMDDAEMSAQVANMWTSVFVERGNAIYGYTNEEIQRLEERLAAADADLEAAQQAMIDFERDNDTFLMQAELSTLRQSYENNLQQYEYAVNLADFIQEFLPQLETTTRSSAIRASDFLLLLNFRLEAYDQLRPGSSNNEQQFQFQLESGLLNDAQSETSIGDSLTQLVASLEERQTRLQTLVNRYETDILALQGEIEANEVRLENLDRDLGLARELYVLLRRKLDEIQSTQGFTGRSLEVASSAIVPERPIFPRWWINAVVGVTLGGLLGVAHAYFMVYWSEDGHASE